MQIPVQALGKHLLLDLWGCNQHLLGNMKQIRELMLEAASHAKAQVLNVMCHQYELQGITCVVVVSESHLSIHTWPEKDYVAIDIYTCGNKAMPDSAAQFIISKLEPASSNIEVVIRGLPSCKA